MHPPAIVLDYAHKKYELTSFTMFIYTVENEFYANVIVFSQI